MEGGGVRNDGQEDAGKAPCLRQDTVSCSVPPCWPLDGFCGSEHKVHPHKESQSCVVQYIIYKCVC